MGTYRQRDPGAAVANGLLASVSYGKVQSCIKGFGGKAMSKFSIKTTYLLAGMDTPNKKLKDAEIKNVRVINLNRLMRLLTGKLESFDAMHKLMPLTKSDFTDAKYERAVVEPAVQATEVDPSRQPDANMSETANANRQHNPRGTPTPPSQQQEMAEESTLTAEPGHGVEMQLSTEEDGSQEDCQEEEMASPGRRQPLRSKTQSKRALSDDDKINPPCKRSRPEPFNRQAHRDQSNLSPPG